MTERKRGAWSAFELERLASLYPRHSEADVARRLGRSVASVRRRARELFSGPRRRGPWSAEEDARLRRAFGALEVAGIALILRRTCTDVRRRARELRRARRQGPWASGEDRLLKELYGTRRDRDLEVCLSRSLGEIRARAAELRLAKDKRLTSRRVPRWTDREIELLRAWYPDHDNLQVARRLGRSVAGVANKASHLGLRKSAEFLRRMGERNVAERRDRRQPGGGGAGGSAESVEDPRQGLNSERCS